MTDTPEQRLAEQVRSDHSGWIVKDYPDSPKQVQKGKPFISVWRPAVVQNSISRTHLDHELKIHAFASKVVDAGAAEELRTLLDGLMLSIERVTAGSFKRADLRSFSEGAFAGWEIDVTIPAPNIYRSTVIQERSENGIAAP